ncbi:MAG: protein of unknown function phage head/tail component [Herbinix sp.]|nr:protein of unknown function phage head/tail component [Herbinix sp.]
MNNYNHNRAEIEKLRKQLRSMFKDISEIDARVLTVSVNKGVASAKRNTPVVTGFMRKMWGSTPTRRKKRKGAEKGMYNAADYSSYVNDGHRLVNGAGETIGFVEGQHQLETAEKAVRRSMRQEFSKEVERVNRKYDK